jgi:heptosyltransferase-1
MSPDRPQSDSRILIVRLSAIGDVVHGLPALRMLRQAFPRATLGWVVEDFASAFLENHPDLDRLHVIPKKRWRGVSAFWRRLRPEILPFLREIRQERYDVAVDLQGLTKSGVIARLSGAPRRIGFGDAQGREFNKWLTNEKVVPPDEARHVIERNAALLSPLGVEGRPEPPVLALGEADQRRAAEIWRDLGLDGKAPVAGLNVGAGWRTKQWPLEHWSRLGELLHERLGMHPLLLWGTDEEREMAKSVRHDLEGRDIEASLPPSTTLRENAALLERLDLYCGGDTGATHVAAALGTPTLALYGASDPVRNGPFGPRATALQAKGLSCAPCWEKRKCKHEKDRACLANLTPEEVVASARRLLEESC